MASSSISCCSSWAKWGQAAVCRGSQGSAELAARVAKARSQRLILATGIFLWEWQQRPYFLSTNSRTEVMAGLRSSCDQKAFSMANHCYWANGLALLGEAAAEGRGSAGSHAELQCGVPSAAQGDTAHAELQDTSQSQLQGYTQLVFSTLLVLGDPASYFKRTWKQFCMGCRWLWWQAELCCTTARLWHSSAQPQCQQLIAGSRS